MSAIGYPPEALERVPEAAALGLGCGNPTAIADLRSGETVVDLGAGGGFDCFLAADAVGTGGRVVGVDMTPEMVERARTAADRNGIENAEFRLGEIEHLPIADEYADVIISNCVINLSTDKRRVFEEAYRVLTPGGRLAISDIVTSPAGLTALDEGDPEQRARCISGAATIDSLRETIGDVGFESISVRVKEDSEAIVDEMFGDDDAVEYLHSAVIQAEKPARGG